MPNSRAIHTACRFGWIRTIQISPSIKYFSFRFGVKPKTIALSAIAVLLS
jgi:hypothetical protein